MNFDDYRGNSFKERETEPAKAARTVSRIASGHLAKRNVFQKVTEMILAEDMDSVKEYILMDVIVPSVKKAIVDSVDMLVNGQVRSKGTTSKGSYVSYESRYGKSADTARTVSRPGYRCDNVVVSTRGEAERILTDMEAALERFGVVSVADLYDMAGITSSYTDNKYGWKSMEDITTLRTSEGYIIKCPKAVPLD